VRSAPCGLEYQACACCAHCFSIHTLTDVHFAIPPEQPRQENPLTHIQHTMALELIGDQILTKDGLKPRAEVLGDCDAVGLYFSASW